jgi:transposase
VQTKLHDVEMSLRGILRGFGLKVGATTPRTFEGRMRELVSGHATLMVVVEALLAARSVLAKEFQGLETRVRAMAKTDERVRLRCRRPTLGPIAHLCLGDRRSGTVPIFRARRRSFRAHAEALPVG